MSKLWFSLYDRKEYTGNEPAFYDTNTLGFAKLFENNWTVIKSELEEYLKSHQLQSYFNSTMVAEQHSWKTISLKWWGINFYKNQNDFPETTKLLRSIDGLVSASFNLLQSGGRIRPHCGDTNGIYRVHLGLEIPGTIPECGFRVKEDWRSWEEGKILVFVDANNHEAINMSPNNRFIFLFDVVRPEYRHQKNYISSTVISSLFIQKRAESLKLLYKSPMWIQKTVGFLLVPFAYVSIQLRNGLFSLLKK
jgi:aspartyl/asparaginyl beta-hydroxylase (cupin superfamily)